ncbi:hypothetical protein KIN20_032970 [Parelaphostrongylus tenuis]|uniref:Uncharacterized protein n=1 Tax=Parelaphostrongylus tenuis TaxID=148309 RepID=A0AAD5R7L3_PARTN|nr:hypothetical protein KIN20_032970 [Parelaphostrongylus tenuis]
MECQRAFSSADMKKESGCIIADNKVTGICIGVRNRGEMCNMAVAGMVERMPISANHVSISGTLSEYHYANLSKAIWESVVNRAIQMTSSSFVRHFFSASASISGS